MSKRDTPAARFIRAQLADAFEAIKDRPQLVRMTKQQKAEAFAERRKAFLEKRKADNRDA